MLVRSARSSPIRVFLLAFVAFAYFMPRWADWNIDSRLALVHAIVDRHSLQIDPYHWITWDKAVYNGHYYSDKAPGTAALGAGAYALFVGAKHLPVLGGAVAGLERNSAWNVAISEGRDDTQSKPAAAGRNLGGCQRSGVAGNVQYVPWGNRLVPPFRDWALSKYVVTVGVDAFISALFVAFLFWFLGFFTMTAWFRWLLTGLYALATVALPYSTVFYSHQLAAAFLFVAFALLFLWARGAIRGWAAPAAGFLLGFALFTEYTVALVIVALGLYGLWLLRRRPRSVALFCLAGIIPAAGVLAYNALCFAGPLDTGYSHDFCWSSAQAAGFQGFTYPHLGALFDLTFGPYRGLFYMSPFLLLAVPGLALMVRRGLPVEALTCAAIGAGFILAISAYWGWNGGRVDGPRYLVPVVPFLALPIIFVFEDLRRSRVMWAITTLLAAWSVFATGVLFLGGNLFPESWVRSPLFQYSLPAVAGNHIAPNAGYFLGLRGWSSLLPLIGLFAFISAWPHRGAPAPYRRPAPKRVALRP